MAKTLPLAVVISAIDKASAPLAKLGGRIDAFGAKASKLGASLTLGITAPVVGLFTLATAKAIETDRAMASLGATSGATADQLAEAARAAAAIPGDFDPKHGLDALTAMGKLGLSLAESMAALPLATNLAIASQSDLAETAGLTLKVLRAYNLEVADVARVTDLLATANSQSDLGLAGVAEQLVKVSPLAHDLGLGLEDVAAAVIALGKVGAEPTAVLRASMAALLKPTKQAAEALARLKIHRADIFTSTGDLRGLTEVVEVLEKRGASARDLLDIFGKKAGPGMAALLQQGSSALRATATNLSKVGTAAAQAGARINSTEGALWELDNTLDDLKITLARSGILESVTKMAHGLADVLERANKLDPRLLELGITLATIAAALGPIIWLAGNVVTAFGKIAAAAEWLGSILVPVAAALGLPFELVAAMALAIPAAIFWWDDLTAALARFIQKFDTVKAAANWIEENLLFGKADAFGHVVTAEDRARFEAAIPINRQSQAPAVGAGSRALQQAVEMRRQASTPAGAPAAEVNVRFDNAPKGTKASVTKATGIDVGVDMGWAMIPD
jgi:TP901 family phage tail tape measure protein